MKALVKRIVPGWIKGFFPTPERMADAPAATPAEDAQTHSNLGHALFAQGLFGDAANCYRRALLFNPDYAAAHYNLGTALKQLRRLDEAMAALQRAVQIRPDYAVAYCNLGNVQTSLGQLDQAAASYAQALHSNPLFFEAHSNLLFASNYLPDQTPTPLLAQAVRFGELAAQQARPCVAWGNAPETNRRLRVGLVSGDLRQHPVGFFIESVLAALATQAATRMELIAYFNGPSADGLTERIKNNCHGWRPVQALADEDLARQIADDGIDILLDLSGHSAFNRLPMFAWKPAPVQVSWLGYFATTGVAAIDYLIADPWTLPAADEAHFTEKIWRLPDTRLCFTVPDVEVQISVLPAMANRTITFGCFNNLSKMNDAVVTLWARVLASVPGSRLFLKNLQFGDLSVMQRTVARFAAQGISSDRLILEGPAPRAEYLAAYQRVDIALDPFPYTGGATSVDSLWMGVPVLTLAGESFLARQGVGLLMNAGLPDWIAACPDDYVARAVRHAQDWQALAALRRGLRQQTLHSPLFDAPRFARHFEAALRSMWAVWCTQQTASHS